MKTLVYKCTVVKEKRPKWMQHLIHVLNNAMRQHYDGTQEELERLQYSLERFIEQFRLSGMVICPLPMKIEKEDNQPVLTITKGGRAIITIKFE
ncbi:hypothetical protein EVA_08317 [gut metagenome]|uniref:Uncharacterized protein n=1 Tax=gut metagenome TaxID=749906 RepID=J9GTE5_9ZZZZ